MSEWVPVPLSTQSYEAASLPASAQRLVNMYPEPLPDGGKGQMLLLPTPGLDPLVEVGSGPCRGVRVMGSYAYVVSGEELYQVDVNGNSVLIGTVSGTRHCFMTDNGTHVGIAADEHLYAANASGVIEVNSERYNGATYQDGYGIFTLEGSQAFYITPTDDMTSIDPTDTTNADAFPDNVMGCASYRRELIIFKQKSIEAWYNSGAADFPFQRAQGGTINRGCAASGSIAVSEDTLAWLADDLSVRVLAGYQAQRISTPAIELLIKEVADPSAARAFIYSQGGHTFYVLQFSSLSLSYDFTSGRWHERETFGEDRWRGQWHGALGATSVVGDYETGDVYTLSPTVYFDVEDEPTRRILTSGVLNGSGARVMMDEVLLEVEAGTGATSGDDTDPSIFLEWSDDGGFTWSEPRAAKIGQLGVYSKRVNWTRCGSFYQRILKFTLRANAKFAVTGCRARIEAMAA